MSAGFEGKTVLVTGAAAGIGRAIALAAARAGAKLVLGDIAEAGLAETAAQAEKLGAASVIGVCDIRKQSDLNSLFAKAAERFGHPDIVYANAGIEGPPVALWDYSEADFTRIIDINVSGTWRTFKAALPEMVKRQSGIIVATASIAGLIGTPGLAAYHASKHAVIGLVKATALSVARQGIRINALCPGMVDTAMLDRLAEAQPGLREALMSLNPMGRNATVEEIADAAIWLASNQSTFVTGTTLAVDGGYVAQ